MTAGERGVWFLDWKGQGETPGTCPWPSSSSTESLGKVTHPLISTAAPKHAGYLGSLRIDLWLKKRMQSQGNSKQAAKLTIKLVYCLELMKTQIFGYHGHQRIPHPSCHPSLALYSAFSTLRCCDGMDLLQYETKARRKKSYFGVCFSPLPFHTHIDTVTKKHCKNPPAHTQKVLYKHVPVVHGFTTEGVFYGQGGAWKMWSNMTDNLKASTAKSHLKKTVIGARL